MLFAIDSLFLGCWFSCLFDLITIVASILVVASILQGLLEKATYCSIARSYFRMLDVSTRRFKARRSKMVQEILNRFVPEKKVSATNACQQDLVRYIFVGLKNTYQQQCGTKDS